jgi:hypothetical protein
MGRVSHQPPGLKLPKGRIPALRVVPMPADANGRPRPVPK